MSPPTAFEPEPTAGKHGRHGAEDDVHRLNLSWMIRLRWAAVVGQASLIAFVHSAMGFALPMVPLAAIVLVEAGSNVLARVWLARSVRVTEWTLGSLMVLDVCLFTGLLYLTGGPFNPFSFLYLVYIALAALVLPPRWTWMLVLLALGGNAALFYHHVPLPMDHASHAMEAEHGEPLSLHLKGMWVAFGVGAAFIVYFLHRVTRALAERDAELARIREQTARSERLASVATLAAGAAHELATPLSTIAVIAKELERPREHEATAKDAQLIRREVERCRDILSQMAGDAGESPGELAAPATIDELIDKAIDGLSGRERIEVRMAEALGPQRIVVPLRAMAQALRGVIKNALDASPKTRSVELSVTRSDAGWSFEVRDHGEGMAPAVVARATEPFFTTKEPGSGMGLGLFLTRSVIDFLGGTFELQSSEGRGTVATLSLPAPPPTDERDEAA